MSMKEEQKNRAEVFQEQQLVVFKVADEEFGVDINEVKEIIRWEEVTRIPNAAPYIKGVINLRGNIIVVNDLAMKLGLPSKDVDDDTRILVVEVGDNTVGMIVDSATEVLRLPGEKIRSAPSLVTGNIDTNYIEGVGLLDEKRLLTLLDLSKVLESQDCEHILQVQQQAQLLCTAESKDEKGSSPDEKKAETNNDVSDFSEEIKGNEKEKRNKQPKNNERTKDQTKKNTINKKK
jgi:purine-binding chemotaxis protein CheW